MDKKFHIVLIILFMVSLIGLAAYSQVYYQSKHDFDIEKQKALLNQISGQKTNYATSSASP